MSLQFTFRGLRVGIPRLPGMLFDFTISNPNPRISTVWSYNFELFQVLDLANEIRFLGPLVANLVIPPEWLYDFPQGEQRACELVWNYKREDIQKVEDVRRDDVHFEIKGNLLVASDYQGGNAPRREVAWDSPRSSNGGHPIHIKIAQSDWIRLLDEIKFTHILLHEFPAPAYHPAFARSVAYWRSAWEHHRKNEPDAALTECFKAFECLGFELTGNKVDRRQLIQKLLAQEPASKQERFLEMLEQIQEFMHLSRHAGTQPAKVDRDDSEMMLLCAASLLGYLSKHHSRAIAATP